MRACPTTLTEQFEEVTRLFRDNDRQGLARLSKQTRRNRAEVAARKAAWGDRAHHEHRCQVVVAVEAEGEDAEDIILTSWQPGKVKDCARCAAKRLPSPVKRSAES